MAQWYCVSSSRGCGFNSQGTHILGKKRTAWMHCQSLQIKASAKYVNVNWLEQNNDNAALNVEKWRVPNPFWAALYLTGRQKKTLFTFSEPLFLKKSPLRMFPKQGLIRFNWRNFFQQFSQSTDCYRLLTASERNLTLTCKEINKPKIEISMATQFGLMNCH